jgi:hypothetical protein
VFQRAAFQARARESRHTGRRPGLGVSGRELKGKQGGPTTARFAVVGVLAAFTPFSGTVAAYEVTP